jgi:Fe-S cluster assembly protein SufD
MNIDTIKDFNNSHAALFKQKGFKETVLDSYKFTKLESFFPEVLGQSEEYQGTIPKFSASFPTITFIDGHFNASDDLPEGIIIKKLAEHFLEIKHKFTEANPLSHLHHSLLQDGLILQVSKHTQVKTPIRILNILTKGSVSAPTHFIIAEPLSKITVLEETRGLAISHALVNETYIDAQEGAQVEYISLDQESEQGLIHSSVFSEVAKDATVRSLIFNCTAKMNRKNLVLNLNAPGANGESFALFLTQGTEHSDINTIINHRSADTTSSQIAKGILDGESKGVFTGKIHIHPQAQRVASSQLNKNLLISKKAQIHSQPQLEIFADDVKCSHGSTTGQLSDDEVFYLEARGIPAEKARSILALGFGFEVVQKIQNEKAREHVAKVIKENLEVKFKLGGGL